MQFQKAVRPLRGEISVPGDKSISHRAVMFGAISEGTTEVTNFLQGADCLSTISCFRSMGIEIENTPERILVHGKGLHGLSAPSAVLDCGNSGTTTRLISGILAGQNFSSTLTGDASIQKRPMGRIINPLTQMGASIRSIPENGCAPLAINGHPLHAISYLSPVASAQVKSCVLLAGLYADGKTSVTEPALSRNHTELMLKFFGADVASEGLTASVLPDPDLHGNLVRVPGDISSAAYFIAAALIVPGSEVLLKNVGINPTRDGMLRVCRAMGADIRLHPADDRRSHRPPHEAERPQCLCNTQQKVEVLGLSHLPRPHAHHDVLLRHRRLDHEVFYPLPRLKRRCRRAGRVLHLVHHLPRLAHRLHADLFGADGVGRVLRRGKGH